MLVVDFVVEVFDDDFLVVWYCFGCFGLFVEVVQQIVDCQIVEWCFVVQLVFVIVYWYCLQFVYEVVQSMFEFDWMVGVVVVLEGYVVWFIGSWLYDDVVVCDFDGVLGVCFEKKGVIDVCFVDYFFVEFVDVWFVFV